MLYIMGTLLRKAFEKQSKFCGHQMDQDEIWKHLMLHPQDYAENALFNDETRMFMKKIQFEHGGEEYDNIYPEGVPTSV